MSSPASLKEVTDNDAAKMLQIVMSEMNDLKTDFRRTIRRFDEKDMSRENIVNQENLSRLDQEYYRARQSFERFQNSIITNSPVEQVKELYDIFQNRAIVTKSQLISINKRRLLQDLSYQADKLFSEYVGKDGN